MYPDAPARTLPDRAGPGLPVKGDAAMLRRSIGELRRPAAAVAVLAVLVYANSLFNGFALDDVPIIAENARVHRLLALRDIWLTPYWPTFGEDLGLYRPLMIFLYAVEWMLGGGRPMLFHAVNVLGHAAASVLALLLLARLVPERPAFFGAALFAVHPVHTEAVANIVGQAEIVAAVAAMGAVLLFTNRPQTLRIPAGRLAGIAGLYAAAVLAKESAIVLPALLLGFDVAARRVPPRELPRYLRASAPVLLALCITAAACLGLRLYALGSITGADAAPSLPFLREQGRILVALRTWPEYARLLFFPVDLSSDYSPGVILPVETLTPAAFAGAALVAATALLALALPWRPVSGIAALWFFASILPVSNLLFPVGIVLAERTLYLPSLTASFVVASAVHAMANAASARAVSLVVALALALLGFRTTIRNPDWMDTTAVQQALIRDHPESYRAQWSAAVHAFERGDTAASERHWMLGYRLWPEDSQFLSEMGAFYIRTDRPHVAIRFLEDAHRRHPRVPRIEHLLSIAYINTHRYPEALTAAERGLRNVGPKSFLEDARARALFALGRYAEAAEAWRAAARRGSPDSWRHWVWRARALAADGREAEAITALDSARVVGAGAPEAAREIERLEALLFGAR